jgi:hypothetical protein
VTGDLLGRRSLHLKFEQMALPRAAELQDTGNVYGRDVDSQPAVKLRQRLIESLFLLQDPPIDVQGDGVHPRE